MTSLPVDSIEAVGPNIISEGGIPKHIFLFGASLVENSLKEAMEEASASIKKEVSTEGEQEDQPASSSRQTVGDENTNDWEERTSDASKTGQGVDQVDAAPQGTSHVGFGIDSQNNQSSETRDSSNETVPKIEITSGSSSESEDSDSSSNSKTRRTKDKKSSQSSTIDELQIQVDELKKEKEAMKETIETLREENKVLKESLDDEKSKSQKFADDLENFKREKEELTQSFTLESNKKEENFAMAMKDLTEKKQELEEMGKTKEENFTSEIKDLKKQVQELEAVRKTKESQLEEDITKSLSSLQDQERIASSLQGEIDSLKNHVAQLKAELTNKEQELNKAQERERKVIQDNSRLQAQLSNAQTHGEHHTGMVQKLKNEITSLQEKNKRLEKHSSLKDSSVKSELIEQKVVQESNRKLQERIRELEEKVINVNEERQKIKADYDEAVKALEAVDKVYKVRETTLEKYKADYEEATDRLKESEREIDKLKGDLSKTKDKLTRAAEYKSDREELKDQLRRYKEAKQTQKDETEQVKKDLDEERHQLQMAQARAQERGRKIQMMGLELTEVKDTLTIAKSVIDEKEKNMLSIKESLDAEKQKREKLEKEVERLSHVQTKLEYVQEEKHLVECKLKNTEVELTETRTYLDQTNAKRKEIEQNVENLEKEKKDLNLQLEDKGTEIKKQTEVISQKDQELVDKLMEIVEASHCIDELRDELQNMWISYQNDRDWWKQRADKVLGKRPKSAPPKRRSGRDPYSGTLSLPSRQLMKKMGSGPLLNQSYISNSQHKVAWRRPSPAGEEQMPKITTPAENGVSTDNTPQQNDHSSLSTPIVVPSENGAGSPRPPSAPASERPRPKRPVSSYGVRTHPAAPSWSPDEPMSYFSDMDAVAEGDGCGDYDADDEIAASCAVNKGDKVLIQSEIIGEGKMNITGLVKYVGKIGRGGDGGVFVGLKLDQPVGNTNGRIGRKKYFHCLPRHGKMVKLSDVHAVMNPRTRNYTRIRPMTFADY